MSSNIKLIIFIVILLIISAAIIFIDSSINNVNQSMPEINDCIIQADKDYNESVELLNSKNYDEAYQKAISAEDNYNKSISKLSEIRSVYNKDLNNIHKKYIDTTIKELKYKLDAIDELNESIYYLRVYNNYTGSTHGTKANDLMKNATGYQNERNNIVLENPKLFA